MAAMFSAWRWATCQWRPESWTMRAVVCSWSLESALRMASGHGVEGDPPHQRVDLLPGLGSGSVVSAVPWFPPMGGGNRNQSARAAGSGWFRMVGNQRFTREIRGLGAVGSGWFRGLGTTFWGFLVPDAPNQIGNHFGGRSAGLAAALRRAAPSPGDHLRESVQKTSTDEAAEQA